MIEAAGIGFNIADRWLWRNLSLSLQPGECLAVLGPNGAGKSTLFRALLGLCPVAEGVVLRSGAVGYVPQKSAISMDFTVAEVVAMARSAKKGLFSSLGSADWLAVEQALATTGMADFAKRPFQKLSGGERQMVLIARALATDARVLILDEPCSSLDLDRQALVLGLLRRLTGRSQLSILFSTHNPDHAFAIADRSLLLDRHAGFTLGPTHDVLTEAALSHLYSVKVCLSDWQNGTQIHRNMLISYER
ncbi:ABC transporter ATP-binding protein [Aureimonas fodinaquatilis]|uniref:ABC transporter ATP-binding protein n=1 Tax=Aureimonas fodinaquatilis TaxID=2565783 RepID=A0A5B0E0Q2_9HYPH|nr:ABC transporter ATP-binding protein [Aureimonas fodinaquatilis]KAA0971695.1 ABC transporter ATP-binding protein [Aureimonas fodinaquatilis]